MTTNKHHAAFLVAALATLPHTLVSRDRGAEPDLTPSTALTEDAAPRHPVRRVLVYNRAQYSLHAASIAAATEAITLLGKRSAFSVEVSDDPARLFPEALRGLDAVVLNNTLADAYGDAPTAERALASLVAFVESGGGLVALHAATVFGSTVTGTAGERFREMIGGAMTSHPWEGGEPITLRVEDPRHPLVQGFAGREAVLLPFPDEIFELGTPFPRRRSRVLLSLDLRSTPDKGTRPDKDYPISWIHTFGRGRVWVQTLGHYPSVFQDAAFLRNLRDGILFATGDLRADTSPRPAPSFDPDEGFSPIFNGRDLSGWRPLGRPDIWRVEQGAIVGTNPAQRPISENHFLVWTGGQPRDFELKADFLLEGPSANSGIYFRSRERAPGENKDLLVGPQADMSANGWWTGVVMEYQLREKLAERGFKTHINEQGHLNTWQAEDPARLLATVKAGDWNSYHVIARGNLVFLRINDVAMSEVRDHDPRRPLSGFIALQVHVGDPMQVRFRNIRIREFDPR